MINNKYLKEGIFKLNTKFYLISGFTSEAEDKKKKWKAVSKLFGSEVYTI